MDIVLAALTVLVLVVTDWTSRWACLPAAPVRAADRSGDEPRGGERGKAMTRLLASLLVTKESKKLRSLIVSTFASCYYTSKALVTTSDALVTRSKKATSNKNKKMKPNE